MTQSYVLLREQWMNFWTSKGCTRLEPHDVEGGGGNFHPATFFGVLGPHPLRVAYVQPVRRIDWFNDQLLSPASLPLHHLFQVLLKPPPDDVLDMYLESLRSVGINPALHDVRFVPNEFVSESLGASGPGYAVLFDGIKLTQISYYQKVGQIELEPVSVEIATGLDWLLLWCFDYPIDLFSLPWDGSMRYHEVLLPKVHEWAEYYTEVADPKVYYQEYRLMKDEAARLLEKGLVYPSLDYIFRCSHTLNVLQSRRAISKEERARILSEIRDLSIRCAEKYLERRSEAKKPNATSRFRWQAD
ncbi:hypothetical protein SY88_06485 [Clostridiales bacterium PH28_bin88]|nr:hypothetical protein SY88_06485 [Clostridiales bacterium PH28_bin88]